MICKTGEDELHRPPVVALNGVIPNVIAHCQAYFDLQVNGDTLHINVYKMLSKLDCLSNPLPYETKQT